MAERIVAGYQRLFEVRILHHYWLDDGATVFDLIPDQTKKDNRLLTYDVRQFLSVVPTDATKKALLELGCLYKNTALGFVVVSPHEVNIPLDAVFEFVVGVQDPDFYNYTALTLRAQNISEIYYEVEDKTYRFKENVPVVSNLTGASRTRDWGKDLFLSGEIPQLQDADLVEALFLKDNALYQLTGDQPDAGMQIIPYPSTELLYWDLPVYINQGDVQPIALPPGLVESQPYGILLSGEIPDSVFALIQVHSKPVRADDVDYSLIEAGGLPKQIPPIFQIRFKNRSTRWKYYDKQTGKKTDPLLIQENLLPLTYFGNASPNLSSKKTQKPSAGIVTIEKIDPGTDDRIKQLVSDIYI